MSEHEQFAEDLALYSVGALEGEESTRLEAHLATCAACKLELEQLRGDGALLALSVSGPKPPQRARKRLLDAIAKEIPTSRAQDVREIGHPISITPTVSTAKRLPWWGWLGWAATAALVVFAVSLWRENTSLRAQMAQDAFTWRQTMDQQTLELGRARDIVATLTAADAMRVTLVAAKTAPQPQGKAFYLRNRSSLVFVANNMPALPSQKVYELWLIPMNGAPIPAGVFKPDARGSATVVNPPLPAGMEAKAFAITVENEAGALTPTMPIVMMGAAGG
jgi:anti-sigma factor RsiW